MKIGLISDAGTPCQNRSSCLITVLILCAVGCTHTAKTHTRLDAKLAEHSRSLTTAVVDTLHLQPAEQRNAFTSVALQLAREDQRVEGIPLEPIAVPHLLALDATNVPTSELAENKPPPAAILPGASLKFAASSPCGSAPKIDYWHSASVSSRNAISSELVGSNREQLSGSPWAG